MAKSEIRICPMYDPEAEKFDEDYGCMGHFNPGRSESPYCPRCRANEWARRAAEKKRPGSMRRYRNKLSCRLARQNEWLGLDRDQHGKVINITTVRKRRHG